MKGEKKDGRGGPRAGSGRKRSRTGPQEPLPMKEDDESLLNKLVLASPMKNKAVAKILAELLIGDQNSLRLLRAAEVKGTLRADEVREMTRYGQSIKDTLELLGFTGKVEEEDPIAQLRNLGQSKKVKEREAVDPEELLR